MDRLSQDEFARRAADLDWILCDVDGVWTDGGLYYDRRGHAMLRFSARDGQGIRLAQSAGLHVGLLSGRASPALQKRASELQLDVVISGSSDKGASFDEFLQRQNTTPRRVAYIGDDLPDLVVLGRCGLAFAPGDAVSEVHAVAHRILAADGGRGAVREMIEAVLRARGDWERVFSAYTFDA